MRETVRRRLEMAGFGRPEIAQASMIFDDYADFDTVAKHLTDNSLRSTLERCGFREVAPNTSPILPDGAGHDADVSSESRRHRVQRDGP